MTALTSPIARPTRTIRTLSVKVAADAVIYKGAKCGFKGGYLYPWGEGGLSHPCTAMMPEGKPVVGNVIDNTGGADGAVSIPVDFGKEKFLEFFDNDETHPVVQATVGGTCYGVDDHTVSSNSGDGDANGTPWIVQGDNQLGFTQGVFVEVN